MRVVKENLNSSLFPCFSLFWDMHVLYAVLISLLQNHNAENCGTQFASVRWLKELNYFPEQERWQQQAHPRDAVKWQNRRIYIRGSRESGSCERVTQIAADWRRQEIKLHFFYWRALNLHEYRKVWTERKTCKLLQLLLLESQSNCSDFRRSTLNS